MKSYKIKVVNLSGIAFIFNMPKYLFFFFLLFLILLPAFPSPPESIIPEKITLENFDSIEDWELEGPKRNEYNAYLNASRLELPPHAGAEKHLSVTIKGDTGTGFKLRKKKSLPMKGCIRDLEFMAYGNERNIQLFVDLNDNEGNFHRINAGYLDFRGWKKILIPLNQLRSRRTQIGGMKDGMEFLGFFILLDSSVKTVNILIDEIQYSTSECFRLPPMPEKLQ